MAARRVLFPLPGRTIGGSHHSTLLLAKSLDRARYEPVIALHEDGPLAALVRDYGFAFEKLNLPFIPQRAADFMPRKWGLFKQSVQAAADFCRREKVHIVHLDSGVLRFVWQPAAQKAGAKFVHMQRTPLQGFSLEKTLRLPSCDMVLCNSDYTRRTMPFTVRGRCKILYPPADTDRAIPDRQRARQKILQKYDLSPDTVIIGFLANLQFRKKPFLVPEIARVLREEGITNFAFVMAGDIYDGAADITFEKMKSYGLERHVFFAGFAPDPLAFLAACGAMVAPAEKEAFGRTLIEAMQAGTLVIASNRDGHREIIENGVDGFLVVPDDPRAYAEKIIEFMERPRDFQSVIQNAQQKVQQKFGVRAHADEMMRLYDEMG